MGKKYIVKLCPRKQVLSLVNPAVFQKGYLKKQSQKPGFGRKFEILSPKSETDRREAKRQIPAHFKECNLKKQSQFAKGQNGVKYLYERD